MPIHHAIWRVGEQPAPLVSILLASEQQLEDMTHAHPSGWLLPVYPGAVGYIRAPAPILREAVVGELPLSA